MEGDLQVDVGRRVRRIRTERGISQEELARALGVHRTLRSVERLAERLDVDVRLLLGLVAGS
jgi:transcriptional regulator with XRE-family HTH domain